MCLRALCSHAPEVRDREAEASGVKRCCSDLALVLWSPLMVKEQVFLGE